MLNIVPLAVGITANGNQTAVNFGPSASSKPNSRIMPGEVAGLFLLPGPAYDGTVHVEIAADGSTYADSPEFAAGGTPGAAVDLTTGLARLYEIKIAEYMRLVTASRTAGQVSAYIVTGS